MPERAAVFQPVTDILANRHMRVQSIVLKHHRDVPIRRVHIVDHPVADFQRAFGDILQPCDHPQQGGFAAARRADQNDKLAVLNGEAGGLNRLKPVGIDLADAL